MPIETLDFRDVKGAIEAKAWRTSFPAAIEAVYEQHRRRYRARDVNSTVLPCILVYNAFLLIDYLLVADTFGLAVALHLGLVTPYMLWAASVLKREPSKTVRELLTVSGPVLMVSQILTIYLLNSTPDADQYQYLAAMVLVYMGSVLRADARYALAASMVIIVLYATALTAGSSPAAVKIVGMTLMGSAAYLTMMANMRVEQSARHAFLRTLQDRFDRTHALETASRDPLTGLANRRHLGERTAKIWPQLVSDGTPVAILVLDVDRFKVLNDTFGHDAGDLCLRRIADALSATVRKDDLAVRYGGEEFVVFLIGTTGTDAAAVADVIRQAVQALGLEAGGDAAGGVVTVSVGVCAGLASETSLAELIRNADKALYQAKGSGRNRVVLHESERA